MDTLSTDELFLLLDEEPDTVLISVLDENDFAAAHIPQSFNVPFGRDAFEEQVEELVGDVETTVVVYGADDESNDSAAAAMKLEEAGFTKVYDYSGGFEEWLALGGAVERGLE